jgi:cell division protein FtsL
MIDFLYLGNLLSDLSIALIGVVITVFILTVTFLGRAAKISKEKRAEVEQKSKLDFDKDIDLLKEKINTKPTEINQLKKQISDLEKKKDFAEKKILGIEQTYSALRLVNVVIKPGGFFLTSAFLTQWFIPMSIGQVWQAGVFCVAFLCVCLGVKRIISTLVVVQDVSLDGVDDNQLSHIQKGLIDALRTIESEKEPKPVIKFKEKSPFVLKNNIETFIEFEVDLEQPGNKEARNVNVWFIMSPEIQIIPSNEYTTPFFQRSSYPIASAVTTIYKFEIVRKHVIARGKIKIKPTSVGTFKLRYKIDCDSHVEPATRDQEIDIIVE